MASTASLRSGFLLMILCTIFTSAGQLFWKAGAVRIHLSDPLTFFNLPFLLGCGLYVLGSLLLILALRKGELSVLYPVIATSYVWVSILAPFFFPNDVLNWWKVAGVATILASITLLGWSSSRSAANTDNAEESL